MNSTNILKIVLIIFIIICILAALFITYITITEPYTYGHMPELLSYQATLTKISEKEYKTFQKNEGEECSMEKMMTILKKLNYQSRYESSPYREKEYCYQFPTSDRSLYLLQPHNFEQLVVLQNSKENYEIVIKQIQDNPRDASGIYDVRSAGDGIVFYYSGWQNPLKYLRLLLTN